MGSGVGLVFEVWDGNRRIMENRGLVEKGYRWNELMNATSTDR